MSADVLANLINWFTRAVIFGTVILYGALGELLTEKSGNMNLGTPGTMCIGGAFGFAGAYLYEVHTEDPSAAVSIFIGLVVGFFTAALAGLLFSFLTTTLRANQNVTGLALTTFGCGLAKFVGTYIIPEGTTTVKAKFANEVFSNRLPASQTTGVFGRLFLDYGFMMYLALIIAIVLYLFLTRTRKGLNLRAVGESPATADAAGINVGRYKYLATVIGSGIAGLGGVYYVLDYNYGGWSTMAANAISALGWLSLALVIFAIWKPLNAIWGSYLFGIFYWLFNFIPVFGVKLNSAQSSLVEAVPFLVTILVLILISVRKSRDNQGPASLGLSYFREDR